MTPQPWSRQHAALAAAARWKTTTGPSLSRVRTSREPVGHMLTNSFISASASRWQNLHFDPVRLCRGVFPFPVPQDGVLDHLCHADAAGRGPHLSDYKVVSDLQMLDTYAGLILPLIASATGTLLFRQFFMTC